MAPADPSWIGKNNVPAPTAVPYKAKLQRVSSLDQILDIMRLYQPENEQKGVQFTTFMDELLR
jgi:hypothetical protein